MATFLDISGLQYFSSIFVFIFVWIIIYAVLQSLKAFGGNKLVHLMTGLVLGLFVVMSSLATSIVAFTAPIIAVTFLFAVLLNVALSMLGGKFEAMHNVKMVFFILVLVIIVVGAGIKVREGVAVPEDRSDLSKTINLVFHPKFLGMMLIFAISIFTIALLAAKGV
jgi:hypothetical protein